MILNPGNYSISHRKRLLGQTTKPPLSNFGAQKPWKYKQLWGMSPDPSCFIKKKNVICSLFCFLPEFKIKETKKKKNQTKICCSIKDILL